jgi:hypothetical protein
MMVTVDLFDIAILGFATVVFVVYWIFRKGGMR